ncbi:MAG TPA: hypothetical protein VFB07_08310 [Vicinamibacterales bacterium]|nr:hypothetical protein [Vicinamibacterales bacterium]
MQTSASWGRNAAAVGLVLAASVFGAAAQTTAPDVPDVLARVGARVAEYYKRVQNIVCYEKSVVQPVSNMTSFSPGGFARTTESELRIESEAKDDGAPSEATVVRRLLKVNGRVPRERDKTDAAGCTDPNPLSPEPLAFLLPSNQADYRFAFAGYGKGKDANALIFEFLSPGTRGDGKLIEDPNGHRDCWSWELPAAMKGRVWVDATTFDVLRVEEHMTGPGTLRVTLEQQRKHSLPEWITIERYDKTIRLKMASFKDPDETMLLPESIESLILVRNGLQSIRKEQRFTEYRRFLTGGRIVK